MGSVPFEQIGAGQSARLAYQVMGKEGPVLNPSGIRYLAPDAPELRSLESIGRSPSGTLMPLGDASVSTGLAGLNLAVATGTLALSAATYASVQRLHEKADALRLGQAEIIGRLGVLQATADRIECKVEESHFREALKFAVKKSWVGDGLQFAPLLSLKGDLDGLVKVLEEKGGFLWLNPNVRLSSDVRAELQATVSLLEGTKSLVCRAHNLSVEGDPNRTVSEDGQAHAQIVSLLLALAVGARHSVDGYIALMGIIQKWMRAEFTFGGDEAAAQIGALFCAACGDEVDDADKTLVQHRDLLAEARSCSNPLRINDLASLVPLAASLRDTLTEEETKLELDELSALATDKLKQWWVSSDSALLLRATAAVEWLTDPAASTTELKKSPLAVPHLTVVAALESA